MRIALYGLGYVGSVTAAMLAKAGHAVTGIDTNPVKVDLINRGESPVNEPYLADLIRDQVIHGRLTAIKRDENGCNSDAIFICVGTPSRNDGALDDSQVRHVVEEILANRSRSEDPLIVFNRSTCLPDTHLWANRVFKDNSDLNANYVVHPEFLREGSALSDFQSPPLLLFGTEDKTLDLESLSKEFYPNTCLPIHNVGIVEASIAKYASNAFHALLVLCSVLLFLVPCVAFVCFVLLAASATQGTGRFAETSRSRARGRIATQARPPLPPSPSLSLTISCYIILYYAILY